MMQRLQTLGFTFQVSKVDDEYSKVNAAGDDDDDDDSRPSDIKREHEHASRRIFKISPLLLALLVAVSILLGALSLSITQLLSPSSRALHKPESILKSPCGKTPQEAKAKGCHFDLISFCWLPDECFDAQLSQDFDDMRHLEWFQDEKRTQPVSHDEIMTGEFSGLYVDFEYHITHCTAMWKKMHRAVLSGLRIDAYIGNYTHTEHCEQMIMEGETIAFDTLNSQIYVKYPDCGI